uniref:Uncharacterized protein n=1 Tax=Leptobrachium leishanense TaxID=445787 RepID=A0A8C5PKS7_9ANUR
MCDCQQNALFKKNNLKLRNKSSILILLLQLDCRNIRFLNGPWGWWVSSNGHQITSWGGATTNSGRCACGEHGSNCALERSSCNCDANDDVWRTDEGALTDKSILPVQEVRFGDTRNMPMQMAFHSIGKLQCWGTRKNLNVSFLAKYFINK